MGGPRDETGEPRSGRSRAGGRAVHAATASAVAPRAQTWGTLVKNHLPGTLAIDFLTVPTATFGVLS